MRGRWPSLPYSHAAVLLAGLLAALLLARGDEFAPGAGPARFLLADRAAHCLVVVDEDDLPRSVIPVASPRMVCARPPGGAWIVAAGVRGGSRLCLVGAGHEVEARMDVGYVHGLGVLGDGDAVVLEATAAGTCVVRFDGDGERGLLERLPSARCLATDGRWVLVGGGEGVLLLATDPEPGLSGWGLSGRSIDQVECGPWPGWWWALEGEGEGTMHLLGPRLVPRWSRSCGVFDARMAPVPGVESVWVADGARGRAVCLGPGGGLLVELLDLPLRGVGCGRGTADGGVVWGAGGALLHLDVRGVLVRTQGGFGRLSAVASAIP